MKLFLPCCLVFFLAVSQSALIRDDDFVEGRFIIDWVLRGLLESLKPKLANIKIPDVDETIAEQNLNATIKIQNINIRDAEKFNILQLKTNALLFKLANLTLTWNEVNADAIYDINITIKYSKDNAPLNFFAKGNARASLKKVFATIGANMELKDNVLQIKKRGLFGFNVNVQSCNVSFSSILGSEKLGEFVSDFLSKNIPDLIDNLKNPLFDMFQDNIIDFLNGLLKNNGNKSLGGEENRRVILAPVNFAKKGDLFEASEESEELK